MYLQEEALLTPEKIRLPCDAVRASLLIAYEPERHQLPTGETEERNVGEPFEGHEAGIEDHGIGGREAGGGFVGASTADFIGFTAITDRTNGHLRTEAVSGA